VEDMSYASTRSIGIKAGINFKRFFRFSWKQTRHRLSNRWKAQD
jgi:hypothetical protein